MTSVQRDFPLQRIWQDSINAYCDRVVVFSVMDFRDETQLQCLRYLGRLKERCKRKLEQIDVLVTVADLLAV